MNLYLVSRTDTVDYDEYDSMLVAAENEDDARRMKPTDAVAHYSWPDWADHPETLTVELIGTSLDSKPRVVISSYNAG